MFFLIGDATEYQTLIEAGIEKASGLVSRLSEDAYNVFVTLTAKGINQTSTWLPAPRGSSRKKS
ncbi:hypothetical protein CVD28_06905 [Bacillus sp. M6-12]|uniref:NAD-binding protein n=1 Tax=Bacillus sp. M6-12 TaxID=2054166 RepID=UPI000C794CE0|nr:hypothetical protein CVD28_06905 [Bacillus sp. M6-12]